MGMTSMRTSRFGETVLDPPRLPTYLSETYDLRPIVGIPSDEDVKTIHAVIRSLNTVAHLPVFHNPDLSMRLSQHLFGAQMAVYRAEYSKALLPGDQSIYAPPALPSHIPGALERVVGSPSDNDIKATQNALRDVDSLAVNPRLFDADLSMKLSQHLFNIQFARYMHNSAQGEFASGGEGEEPVSAPHPTQEEQGPTNEQPPDIEHGEQSNPRVPPVDRVLEAPPELVQLGEDMQAMKDTMEKSGDTLENINRMLMAIKRDQCMVYVLHNSQHWQKDPLNQQGVLASECGLPRLIYMYNPDGYSWSVSLAEEHIAGYLKFFDVGTDLIQGDEEPKLIAGKKGEAEKLLLAQFIC